MLCAKVNNGQSIETGNTGHTR